MIFKSSWTKDEIERSTYREILPYVEIYYKMYSDEWFNFFKTFAIHNVESTSVAFSSKKGSIQKYVREVSRRKLKIVDEYENDFDNQFEGLDFG